MYITIYIYTYMYIATYLHKYIIYTNGLPCPQFCQEMDDTFWFRFGLRAFPADNCFLLTLINKASNNDTTRVYQIAFFLIRNPIESVI